MKKLLLSLLSMLPLALAAQNLTNYKQAIPLDGAKTGTVRLEIPAGELSLKTGSTKLIDASIAYNHAGWKPNLKLTKTNGATSLTLKQTEDGNKENNGKNKWTVNLTREIPVNLYLVMGAGTSKLDLSNSRLQTLDIEAGAVGVDLNLSGSSVKNVEIDAGVGALNLDLTGDWNHDVALHISGGIGEVNLKLPKNTGVRINPSGLGSKNLYGFRKNGAYYQNAAYGKSKHTLTIHVSGGMGSLNVVEG